jgi:Ca2+-binding EF-hand superfamily protein
MVVMNKIREIRQRLITVSNNSQEEYVVRNMFRTFDKDQSGALTLLELAGLMSKLRVDFTETELEGVMKEIDKNGSGLIEFEEFVQLLVFNPYK